MAKPGMTPNLANPALSEGEVIRAARTNTSNQTDQTSQAVSDPNRLNRVPDRDPSGTAAISPLSGRQQFYPGGSQPGPRQTKQNVIGGRFTD